MGVPELTHLQFAVLDCLESAEQTGRTLRHRLADMGIKKSGPAFYQMMARMEEAKFVEGWYTQKIVESQIIKERRYKISPKGLSALQHVKSFYLRRVPNFAISQGFA